MTFNVAIQEQNGIQQAILEGRLDSATSSTFEKSIETLFTQPGGRALFDFAGIDYVSSAGLRVVLMAAKRARQAQGRLVLCGLSPHVKEVFEISGFLKILTVVDAREAAQGMLAA
jgi:anti-anti-sigma factor